MSAPRWMVARPAEYRWRAIPMFVSQLVVLGIHLAMRGSWELPVTFVAGLVATLMAFTGLFIRVWGTGLISAATMVSMSLSTSRLVTSGVYSLVRNPLYLGDLLIFSAYGVMLSPVLALAFALFHVVRTYRLIFFEEAEMTARWGAEFDEYCRAVPRLVPRLGRPSAAIVDWREGVVASSIWTGFAVGYLASWATGDLWALAPVETAGFVFAAFYFSRTRRAARAVVDA